MVQALGMSVEMTLNLDEGARSQALFLSRQEQRQDRLEGLARSRAGLAFIARRIASQFNLGMQDGGPLARFMRRERGRRPQSKAPLPVADPVLEDPTFFAADAEPQRQAWDGVVKVKRVRFPRGQREGGNVLGR
jgi:hypothetical protein